MKRNADIGLFTNPSRLAKRPWGKETKQVGRLVDLFRSRRSIRKFTDKAVEADIVALLMEAVDMAPSDKCWWDRLATACIRFVASS